MSSAFERFRETRFFGSLNGLRAVSILGVVWVHSWYGTAFEWPKAIPYGNGAELGVALFFTISGFLITTLLLREREKFGTISLRDFFIRRALRIWPLYYLVLGIYVVLVLLTERHTERGAIFFYNLPTFITYTYIWFGTFEGGAIFNFSWSLSTEEQFYVFWPLAIKALPRAWPIGLAVLAVGVRLAMGWGWLGSVVAADTFPGLVLIGISVPICFGAMLAYLLSHSRGFDAAYRVVGWKMAAPVLMVVLLTAAEWLSAASSLLIWIILPLVVGACVIREDNGLARVLRWKPLAHMGVLSYGMYLWCNLVIKAVRAGAGHAGVGHPLFLFPVVLGATVLTAWVSRRFYELWFLRLKERFSRLKGPAPESAEGTIANQPPAEPGANAKIV